MATNTYSTLGLVELAKRKDPSGNPAVIAEVLSRTNRILQDAPWSEANDTFSHMITRRLKLPTGSFRMLNAGVATEASQTIQVSETIGMLESFSQVDQALADAAPNPAQFRMQEAAAFIEGMFQTHATKTIYGNSHSTPEEFTGLAYRMNDLDCNNVVGAGGSGGDTTSIYIVQWGEDKVHFVYPKGAPNVGISHKDLGLAPVDVTTTAGTHSYMMAYRDHFKLACGLVVRDNRCIARVANIEATGTSNIFDPDDLIDLLNAMVGEGEGACIYCNRYIFSQMDKMAMDKSNVLYTTGQIWGVPTTMFRGFPVRKVDAITITETAVA